MKWRTKAAAVFAAIASLLPFSTQAQTLYVASGAGGVAGNLFTVDPTTAAATVVGPILVGAAPIAMTGLAFHPTTGVLYGITSVNSPNFPSTLVTINPATGAATTIGAGLGIGGADITFNAAGTMYMSSGQATNLYTVNIATGVATLVGATGTGDSGSGLAINGAGTAFFSGNSSGGTLDTLNLATGAATAGPALTGAPIAGTINSMKFNAAGVLYGANNSNPGGVNVDLVTINTATGAVTTIGALPTRIDGLAFQVLAGAGPLPGPTLGEWGLIALALLLAAVGALAIGRRRSA